MIGTGRQATGQRGSLLIISLLILLALASVGLVVVQKVATEQNFVGNARRGMVAYRVSEAGAFAALSYADSLGPTGFLHLLDENTVDAGTADERVEMTPDGIMQKVSTTVMSFFDLSESGSFGYEGKLAEDDATAAATPPPMDFRVRIRRAGMTQPLEGYEMTGPGARCRFKYEFDIDGNVGDSSGQDTGQSFSAWKRLRALMNVGPLPCSRQAAGTGNI